jgi:hypothetical protein
MRTKVMIRRQVVLASVAAATMLAVAGTASADVVSDQSGAVLIFPKIVVDTSGVFGEPTDTELQITNTSNSIVSARCVLVDTTPRCISPTGEPDTACTVAGEANGDGRCAVGSPCTPVWRKGNDFQFTLTKRQPISWKASEGLPSFPCGGPVQDPNAPSGCPFGSNVGSDGSPSAIPRVGDNPFFGEIKCAQVNPEDFRPTVGFSDGNDRGGDLSGKATIVSVAGDLAVDARKYNAVALKSTGVNNGDDVLRIGGVDAEYNGCPHSLILQHVFDGAQIEYNGGSSEVTTDVTLVSCSQDFLNDATSPITLQLLVFNEFEQRFSASERFDCWTETRLSDLVNRPGEDDDDFSLWNVNVQGTLTGQTRIRPVSTSTRANGVLGIGEEFWTRNMNNGHQHSSAFQLNLSGMNMLGDEIVLNPNF